MGAVSLFQFKLVVLALPARVFLYSSLVMGLSISSYPSMSPTVQSADSHTGHFLTPTALCHYFTITEGEHPEGVVSP